MSKKKKEKKRTKKEKKYLLKHGYDMYATWDTFSWFITNTRSILKKYRKNMVGYPVIIEEYRNELNKDSNSEICKKLEKENVHEWNRIVDRMIELLDEMDEMHPMYEDMDLHEAFEKRDRAKDEFFELFSKHFWNLWD